MGPQGGKKGWSRVGQAWREGPCVYSCSVFSPHDCLRRSAFLSPFSRPREAVCLSKVMRLESGRTRPRLIRPPPPTLMLSPLDPVESRDGGNLSGPFSPCPRESVHFPSAERPLFLLPKCL